MTPDRDRSFVCSCCGVLGVRYHFTVVSARPANLPRVTLLDQAVLLAKLRHAHR